MGADISWIYFQALYWVSGIFPSTSGFPSSIQDGISSIMNFGRQFGFIVPWDTVFQIFMMLITFELGLFLFKMTIIVVDWIRGSGA